MRSYLVAFGQRVRITHHRLGRWAWPVWVSSSAVAVVLFNLLLVVPGPGGIRSAANMPVSTLVYDMRDRPVFNIFREHRTLVGLNQISPHMLRAVLAVEDERFYRHHGIDLWRMGGAAVANFKQRAIVQGGSTITQQLARKTFLNDNKTIWRKAREIVLAVRLEWVFSKDEILEMYLNRIYFGRGFYGIEAAAQGYFGKPALALTVDEAALLAGLIQAPSAYAPPSNLDRAIARRTVVLRRMQAVGALTEEQTARAIKAKVQLRRELGQPRFGEYFRNRVAQELVERFGEDQVWNGGLRVYTTVNPLMQRAAERALTMGLSQIERRTGFSGPLLEDDAAVANGRTAYLQGAIVALDPRNGHVRALVGGRDFDDSTFDRAIDAQRQAGSAYKPFVFAAAIESGANPATLITGINNATRASGVDWRPDNDRGSDVDVLTMREALRTSNNRAAVRLLSTVGIPAAVGAAVRLGLTAPPPVPSLVLGSGEVSLLSMTSAYGAFADHGTVHTPVFVRRVEDSAGVVLWEHAAESHQALSPSTAFMMADMLADVVDRGTGARARQEGFLLPAGGKTGTTNDYKDTWFVGFTPTLVAGVWAGFDEPKPVAPDGYATGLVVPIWARFMRGATAGAKAAWLEAPDDVVSVQVCRRSGLKPTDACAKDGNSVAFEYFRRGTAPNDFCEFHGGRSFFERLNLGSIGCKLFGKGC
ncbi:MAG TPA: PBP1A family penicillin-binding protein [Vicinamibacterales bacterium]|nr:PBP1A family penicillin-binding protein [Vicinamibacterales bacterium]